jgi:tetratricopeptide (TPR) repeat protein
MLAYFSRANCQLKITDLIEQVRQNTEALTLPVRNNPAQPSTVTTEFVTDYTNVLTDYAKCLKINPNFAFAYFNQAYVKCKLRDYEGALADLNQALEIEKDFAEAYFNRGLTKIYLDDVEGGAMDLSKAGELGIQDAYNIIKRYCN